MANLFHDPTKMLSFAILISQECGAEVFRSYMTRDDITSVVKEGFAYDFKSSLRQ